MRNKIFEAVLQETPKDIALFVDWYADLVVVVNKQIQTKQLTQDNVDKDSQVYAWFISEFDFSLRSIAKLSVELEVDLVKVNK